MNQRFDSGNNFERENEGSGSKNENIEIEIQTPKIRMQKLKIWGERHIKKVVNLSKLPTAF